MLRDNHSMIWDVTLTSDTSGSWGCGAFLSNGEWFQVQWPQSLVGSPDYGEGISSGGTRSSDLVLGSQIRVEQE